MSGVDFNESEAPSEGSLVEGSSSCEGSLVEVGGSKNSGIQGSSVELASFSVTCWTGLIKDVIWPTRPVAVL